MKAASSESLIFIYHHVHELSDGWPASRLRVDICGCAISSAIGTKDAEAKI